MWKRTSSILILATLLINMMGYFPVFKIEQMRVRYDVKRKIEQELPDSELIKITVNKFNGSQLKWIEEGKEFQYLSKMYDVIKSKTVGNVIQYYCLSDTKETHLLAHLDDYVKLQMANNLRLPQNPLRNLSKVFLSLVYLPASSITNFSSFKLLKYNRSQTFTLPIPHLSRIFSPPQYCA